MSRHTRLQHTMRSPDRQARTVHSRRNRILASQLRESLLNSQPYRPFPYDRPLGTLTVIHTRPKGPRYADGDCRRTPDWQPQAKRQFLSIWRATARMRQKRKQGDDHATPQD